MLRTGSKEEIQNFQSQLLLDSYLEYPETHKSLMYSSLKQELQGNSGIKFDYRIVDRFKAKLDDQVK